MRRLLLIAAILTTTLAIFWNADYTPGQVSVPLFFGVGVLALWWVCTPRRTRKTHQ